MGRLERAGDVVDQWPPDGSLAGHPGAPARHPGLQELLVAQQLERLLYGAAPDSGNAA